MDFIQLENAVKISEAESINQASMNLYLTQSALNSSSCAWKRNLASSFFNAQKPAFPLRKPASCFWDMQERS